MRDAPEVEVQRVGLTGIAGLRGEYRAGARCQIVRDSILPRELGDPYRLLVGGRTVGYAGIWNSHFPGRVFEVFLLPGYRSRAPALLRRLAEHAEATEIEAQTNLYDGRALVEACATTIRVENLLFGRGTETALDRPELTFRRRVKADVGPEGEWVTEREGRVVAAGGWLTHYNPPYADLYLEVASGQRGQGVGSFLVQELRRACSGAGLVPAARCEVGNEGSRRCLQRGGMELCGEILVGRLERG